MSLRQRWFICPDGFVRRVYTSTKTVRQENDPILALGLEALAAGDEAMVKLCTRARKGDKQAIAQCEKVIADARAQKD